MKPQNSSAGFWIRLVTRLIDMAIPFGISIGMVFGLVEHKTTWEFKEDWMFYVWDIATVLLMAMSFIIIPWLTKGRTIGMFITSTKIVFNEKPLISILKREAVFGIGWITILLVAMAAINHTLASEFARADQKAIKYTDLEKLRIGVVSSIGGLLVILQLMCVIGIISKRDKRGFHDRTSNTKTVWINKFDVDETPKLIKSIEPKLVNDEKIEWIK